MLVKFKAIKLSLIKILQLILYLIVLFLSTSPIQNKLDAFKSVLSQLPQTNHDNLKYLIKFLCKVVENSEKTKMTTSNLGICFSVSLLNNTGMNTSMTSSINGLNSNYSDSKTIDMSTAAQIFDFILTNHKELFPGDISSLNISSGSNYTTLPKTNTNPITHTSSESSSFGSTSSLSSAPAIIQRQSTRNTLDISNVGNSSESPKANRYSVMYADPESHFTSFQKNLVPINTINNSPSTTIVSSVVNTNRHIKKGSTDLRQFENETMSPANNSAKNAQSSYTSNNE